jgi:hypothetical protein
MEERELVVNPSLKMVGLECQRFLNNFLRNNVNPRKPLFPIDRVVAFFISNEKKQRLIKSTRNRSIYSIPERDDIFMLRYAINFGITRKVASFCINLRFGPKLKVPNQIAVDLKDEFVESNKLLRDKYRLPVGTFGWVL